MVYKYFIYSYTHINQVDKKKKHESNSFSDYTLFQDNYAVRYIFETSKL
jgi:hypothetical protein